MNTEERLIKGMEIAAKRGSQYNIEVLNEEIVPTLMILTGNDRIELAHILVESEDMADALKEFLLEKQAKAYALILEAWQTSFIEEASKYGGRVRDMPLDDRFEVANITTVSRLDGIKKSYSSRIRTSPTSGKRQLQSWTENSLELAQKCVIDW